MIDFIDFDKMNNNNNENNKVIEQYVTESNKVVKGITNLSKINIFVGENNSGKSRLLRELAKNNFFKYYEIKDYDINYIKNTVERSNHSNDIIDNIINRFTKIYNTKNRSAIISFILDVIDELEENNAYGIKEYKNLLKDRYDWIKNSSNSTTKNDTKRIYIPILRGIENFKQTVDKLQSTLPNLRLSMDEINIFNQYINQVDKMYQKKIEKMYFTNYTSRVLQIHTGETIYEDVQNKLLGTEEERNIIKEFERFLSKNFFDNKNITIIPNIKKKYLYVNIDGEERALHNLGEGIKQIIIITYKMFMHKNEEMLFFVEEPELNLHPGLQRKLIEAMLSEEFEKHQFFLTTHSNHLLDLTLDYNNISVYKLNKNKSKMKLLQVSKGDKSLLEVLGVKSSSIFTSNCTIWVEGITDRLFIRKYLELYEEYLIKKGELDKKLEEDIDYSFVEYSGSNIIHWNFEYEDSDENINSKYLNKYIFLVADNDFPKDDSKKAKNQEYLQHILKDNYYKLPVREIENLLSVDILKKVIMDRENNTNIILKPDITTENVYIKEHLGKFINDRLENKRYNYVKSDSKMLYNKVDFCNRSLKFLNDYDDMSVQAKRLAKKVYEFIIKYK